MKGDLKACLYLSAIPVGAGIEEEANRKRKLELSMDSYRGPNN